MNLRHLLYLRLVVEQGSFEAAAAAAGVTQPAVSHGLRRLQARFDTPLFEREGRRLVPTAFARRLASEGGALWTRAQALGDTPGAPAAPATLRVGLTPSAALVCGPLLHEAWCAGRPSRVLAMASADEGSLLGALQRGELDLAIVPRPRGRARSGVAGWPLYPITPQVVARRGHPLAAAASLAALQRSRWAVVAPSVSGPVDVLSEAFAVRSMPPPQVAVRCADYASMLNLVAATDLLAVVPHGALLDGTAAGRVQPLRLRETLPLYEMWLYQASGSARRTGAVARRLKAAWPAQRTTR